MKAQTKRMLAVTIAVPSYFMSSTFINWGFDPASWTISDRAGFVVFLAFVIGAALLAPFKDDHP